MFVDRLQQPLYGRPHIWDQKGIGQVFEFGAQVGFEGGVRGQTSLVDQMSQDQWEWARVTGSMVLERCAAWYPFEKLGSHESLRTLWDNGDGIQGLKQKVRISVHVDKMTRH